MPCVFHAIFQYICHQPHLISAALEGYTTVVPINDHKRLCTSELDHSSWFSPFHGEFLTVLWRAKQRPIRFSPSTPSTLKLCNTTKYAPRINLKPPEQWRGAEHRAHIHVGWAICEHVGPLYIATDATINCRLSSAGQECRCISMKPRGTTFFARLIVIPYITAVLVSTCTPRMPYGSSSIKRSSVTRYL